jgi:hypothetical protein
MDNNIRVAELKKEIEEYISLGNNSIIYDVEEGNGRVTINAITVNPRHNQSFLFHTSVGLDEVDAFQQMSEYVKSYKEKESSYTIQWSVIGDDRLQTSYFSSKNIIGALDKLYFDRDPNTVTIFSVSLNPIT